jgi:hypothetical protein
MISLFKLMYGFLVYPDDICSWAYVCICIVFLVHLRYLGLCMNTWCTHVISVFGLMYAHVLYSCCICMISVSGLMCANLMYSWFICMISVFGLMYVCTCIVFLVHLYDICIWAYVCTCIVFLARSLRYLYLGLCLHMYCIPGSSV